MFPIQITQGIINQFMVMNVPFLKISANLFCFLTQKKKGKVFCEKIIYQHGIIGDKWRIYSSFKCF